MRLQEDLTEARKRSGKKHKSGHKPLNKQLTIAAVIVLVGLVLVFFSGSWLFTDGEDDSADPAVTEKKEPPQNFAPEVIADYYIDYGNGTIPLGDLPVGTRVVDPSWDWEFRTGRGYAWESGDLTKPVTWIVVAKDHYEGLEPHVTLLSEELIGRLTFDNSTDRGSSWGNNHCGESGTGNATRGLRPWLNSSGIHAGEGFYRSFSENFKRAILTTTVPNKKWQNGSSYSTSDHVFIPSATELNAADHNRTYPVGRVCAYFAGVGNVDRVARLGEAAWWYWTRSPDSFRGDLMRLISSAGDSGNGSAYYDYRAHDGLRPALNLKSEILVSEINH